jgi:hypothetical protein
MKSGIKTTEFWMTMLTSVISLVGALEGIIPADISVMIIAGANAAYGFMRAITKAGSNA